jgi:hypothetical protein
MKAPLTRSQLHKIAEIQEALQEIGKLTLGINLGLASLNLDDPPGSLRTFDVGRLWGDLEAIQFQSSLAKEKLATGLKLREAA